MTIWKKRGLCFCVSCGLSVLAGLVKSPFFLTFLDTWSIIGLLMLLIGILTYFSSRGYYDSLHFTIDRIRQGFQKSKGDNLSYAQFHQQQLSKTRCTQPVLMPVGAIVTAICLILSYGVWPMI